jgi:hypothetical protein
MSLVEPMSLIVKNSDDFSKMYNEVDDYDLEEPKGCCSIFSSCVSTIVIIMVSICGFSYYLEQQTAKLALRVKVEMCRLEF